MFGRCVYRACALQRASASGRSGTAPYTGLGTTASSQPHHALPARQSSFTDGRASVGAWVHMFVLIETSGRDCKSRTGTTDGERHGVITPRAHGEESIASRTLLSRSSLLNGF